MPSKPETESRETRFLALWSNANFDPLMKNDCAVQAGFTPKSAAVGSNRVIRTLIQNQKMQKALKKRGITMDKLATKLAEQLEAMHPFAPKQPDNLARNKAIDIGLKIHDAYPSTKIDIDKHDRKEIVITGEVVQRIERYNAQRELIERGDVFDVVPSTD